MRNIQVSSLGPSIFCIKILIRPFDSVTKSLPIKEEVPGSILGSIVGLFPSVELFPDTDSVFWYLLSMFSPVLCLEEVFLLY